MSHHNQPGTEWADRHRRALSARHTHEDFLTDRQFELLLEACSGLLAPHDFEDGSWMIVETYADDRVENNLTPFGRLGYSISTLACTPNSLSQDVGYGLGAQAGEDRTRQVVTEGGFTRFRQAAKTPTSLVFEAKS